MIEILKVRGESMLPFAKEGDFVLVLKFLKAKKGRVVLAQDPRDKRLIMKRVESVEGDKVFLLGDNDSKSTDSRHFGPVNKKDVLGTVFKVLSTKEVF